MSLEVQPYQLNNLVINDLDAIPRLSPASKKVLETFDTHVPLPFQETPCMDDRQIQSIEETRRLLKETTDHSTRDKAIAFLKTAAVVILVAGAIAACVFGGEIGLALGACLGAIVFVFLNAGLFEDARTKIEKIEQRLPQNHHWSMTLPHRQDAEIQPGTARAAIAGILGAGLYMPLIEAFTRKSRLEKVLSQQNITHQKATQEHHKAISRIREENAKLLAEASLFYLTQAPGLIEQLNQKIEQCEKGLAGMEAFDKTALKEPTDFLLNYRKTRAELNDIFEFYKKSKH